MILKNSVTASALFAAYFSSLHHTSGDAWDFVPSRIVLVVFMALMQFASSRYNVLWIGSEFAHAWKLTGCCLNYVASTAMFLLLTHSADSRDAPQRMLTADHSYMVLLLGFTRMFSAHILHKQSSFKTWFDIILDWILSPISYFLICWLPVERQLNTGQNQSSFASWLNFAILSAAHIFQENAPASKKTHPWQLLIRTSVLLCGIVFFQLRTPDLQTEQTETHDSDFHIFRSVVADYPGSIRFFLLTWAGLSSTRWFSNIAETLFPAQSIPISSAADVEDAQFALSLAGMLVGLYCCMSPCHQLDDCMPLSDSSIRHHGNMMMQGLLTVAICSGGAKLIQRTAVQLKLFFSTSKKKAK